ncbi:MAG: universal stress protein [Planctomycetota bacterium]
MKKHVIICPVDYSESTESAISLAVDLAKVHHSKVILLHVVEPHGKPISMSEAVNHKFQERLRDQYLDLNDIDHDHLNRHGDPAEVIIQDAETFAADLIVMGTHGRSGWTGLVTGSVAKKVMANAHCPVVTVKLPTPVAKT